VRERIEEGGREERKYLEKLYNVRIN